MNNSKPTTEPAEEKLVDIDELIETLWTPQSAPPKQSIYKLAQKGAIPSEKLGKRNFFLPSAVREAMSRKMKFRASDKFSDSDEKQRDDFHHNKSEVERRRLFHDMSE